MDIRISILKTISHVWENDKSSEPYLRDTLINYSCQEINEWFSEKIKYNNPFPNFGIRFLPAVAKWNLYGDNKWTKHQSEVIEITLPLMPKGTEWNEYEKADYLMQYYGKFPTFFGSVANPPKDSGSVQKSCNDVGVGSTYDPSGNDYDLGVSQDSFLSFSAVMIKLVAAIWEDESLIAKLDYRHHKECHESKKKYFKNIRNILKDYFDYDLPWRFNFEFVLPNHDEAFWIKGPTDQDCDEWQWNDKNVIRTTVFIEIPYAPTGKENASLALARYNATGPAYPFTCS